MCVLNVEPLRGDPGGERGGIVFGTNISCDPEVLVIPVAVFLFSLDRIAKLLHRSCVTTVMSMKLRGNGSVFLFASTTGMMGKGVIPNRTRI